MKITAIEEYGLRCLLHVARREQEGKSVSLREIAQLEQISLHYATKLVTSLRKAGLVTSVRGSKGGFRLIRPPEDVTVAQIMQALDGSLAEEEKTLTEKFCNRYSGLHGECVRKAGCMVRPLWLTLSKYLYGAMSHITLKQFLENEANADQFVKEAFHKYMQETTS